MLVYLWLAAGGVALLTPWAYGAVAVFLAVFLHFALTEEALPVEKR